MCGETVYIVDDDASVRSALSLMLGLLKHATMAFESAEDFLVAFEPSSPGCVITDIHMRGMSGLELLRLLRRRGTAIPFILISGGGEEATARQAILAGAANFLQKPFRSEELMAAVEAALITSQATRHVQ